ncbi:hypothetical protein ES703_81977 [subsurface metagenome]
MKNWYRQAYYSYKGLFGWLNWPAYISTIIFRPFLNVALIALVGKFALNPEAAEAFIINMTAYQIPFIVLAGITNCVTRDRFFGTLQFMYFSRGSRTVAYFSKSVFHLPNAFLVVTIVLFSAWLILGLDFGEVNWLSMVVSILVITISSATAGLFIGNFAIIMSNWAMVYGVFSGMMLALNGVVIPIASLPGFLQPISQILPLTHGLVAFRQAFTGASITFVSNNLLLELLVGFIYAITGLLLYRLMEREAKRRGTLGSPGA